MQIEIKIPEKVNFIISRLAEHGFEAYAVGGCVRDSVLGRMPKDWDVTTSAKPNEVKQIFKRTIDTGIEHGTVTVLLEREGFEVTTYRVDGEYEDSRHPKKVEFTENLVKDLERRDFTINAMAYNPSTGLVDVFGGYEDIEKKLIRCVGSPAERFDEDALRILRALRFSAQLGFGIDPKTQDAVRKLAVNLNHISAERIREELNKLLLSKHPEVLREAADMGITKVVLPEFDQMLQTEQNNSFHIYNVGMHSLKAVRVINELYDTAELLFNCNDDNSENIVSIVAVDKPKDHKTNDRETKDLKTIEHKTIDHNKTIDLKTEDSKNKVFFTQDIMEKLNSNFPEQLFSSRFRAILCWTMLLHDVAKPKMKQTDPEGVDHFYRHPEEGSELAKDILKRLKFDNYTVDMAKRLILYHDSEFRLTPAGLRKAIHRMGEEAIVLLFFVKYADTMAQNPAKHEKKLESLNKALSIYLDVMNKEECISLKTLDVNGRDLMEAGIQEGKLLGEILNYLLELVIENPDLNNKDKLLDLALKYVSKES